MKKNTSDFPLLDDDENFLDFSNIDPEQMERVFQVIDFLANKKQLMMKFSPEVIHFLDKNDNITEIASDYEFNDLIIGLIKNELVDHFNFNPEEIMILTEFDFLDLVTDGYFFDKNNYLRGDNNDKYKNSVH